MTENKIKPRLEDILHACFFTSSSDFGLLALCDFSAQVWLYTQYFKDVIGRCDRTETCTDLGGEPSVPYSETRRPFSLVQINGIQHLQLWKQECIILYVRTFAVDEKGPEFKLVMDQALEKKNGKKRTKKTFWLSSILTRQC